MGTYLIIDLFVAIVFFAAIALTVIRGKHQKKVWNKHVTEALSILNK